MSYKVIQLIIKIFVMLSPFKLLKTMQVEYRKDNELHNTNPLEQLKTHDPQSIGRSSSMSRTQFLQQINSVCLKRKFFFLLPFSFPTTVLFVKVYWEVSIVLVEYILELHSYKHKQALSQWHMSFSSWISAVADLKGD